MACFTSGSHTASRVLFKSLVKCKPTHIIRTIKGGTTPGCLGGARLGEASRTQVGAVQVAGGARPFSRRAPPHPGLSGQPWEGRVLLRKTQIADWQARTRGELGALGVLPLWSHSPGLSSVARPASGGLPWLEPETHRQAGCGFTV